MGWPGPRALGGAIKIWVAHQDLCGTGLLHLQGSVTRSHCFLERERPWQSRAMLRAADKVFDPSAPMGSGREAQPSQPPAPAPRLRTGRAVPASLHARRAQRAQKIRWTTGFSSPRVRFTACRQLGR